MNHTTYKFRLYPTEEQALSLTQMFGAQRALWNVALAQRINRLKYPKSAEVNPAYTSQTCSQCGYCSSENRKSQSEFECQQCGYKANADVNAACNILYAGTAPVSACGGHKVAVETGTIANYVSG